MATWQTELQRAKQTVVSKFGDGKRTISDFFSGTVSKKIADASSFFRNGVTVVGINVGEIPEMKKAIRGYVEDINKALENLKNYDPKVAFKGDVLVPALEGYIDAVIKTCGAVTSNMLAFNDQLTEVQTAYANKDKSASSAIKQSAESTSSAYTKYVEQGDSGK